MSRITVDFGIDLGTTNSAIAVLTGTTPEIIKITADRNSDITPSAVYIGNRGTIIGTRAKSALEKEDTANDAHVEFKRFMGKDRVYKFKAAKRAMRAEELSAEVLKLLCGEAQARFGEVVQAAAISVPAAFEQNQCAATKKAGELAGLIQCPLLQEPVAAALAYGFQAEVTKELWLVYDFGGGTFDAAVIKAEEGNISVVNHGGDNYLGGSDIDWAIIDQLVLPVLQKNYNLPELQRGNKKWFVQLAVLKRSVEEAKIELSRKDKSYLEGCRISDADGKVIDVDLELSRDSVIAIAEPIIKRSVDICKRVLQEKNLSANVIGKMILVGGPTLAPYFREILTSGLNIPLDFTIDPLTVVARGAAVFAGTQRLEGKAMPTADAGQFNVVLKYKPIGADEEFTLRGEVTSPSGSSVDGFTIEFVSQNTHWRSGKVALKADGKYKIRLIAEKGCKNIFSIELLDAKGRRQEAVPSQMPYTIGLAVSEQPITNTIAVALANNEKSVYFKKGDPLPAKGTQLFHTIHTVKKSDSGDILRVPVVEGEAILADRNKFLGHLEVCGSNIKRDLPAGTEVEVTLLQDASQVILVRAYIPLLDEEFETKLIRNETSADPKRLTQELKTEAARLQKLQEKADEIDEDVVAEQLEELQQMDTVEGIGKMIGEDEADKAEKRILELRIMLDAAEDEMQWAGLVLEAQERLGRLDSLLEYGTPDQVTRAQELRSQVEQAISQKRGDRLRLLQGRVSELVGAMLSEQPAYWLGFFEYLINERDKMSDQAAVQRLWNQGRACVEQGNLQGLRSVVRQLWELLPQEMAEIVRFGYDSSLLK